MLQFLLAYLILLLKTKVVCIDIKVSIGKKIGNDIDNIYPIYFNLNEPLINRKNPIDLFCIFDVTSKMNIINLKRTLYLIVDILNSKDRLSLILFDNKEVREKLNLSLMNGSNKKKAKRIINSISNTDYKKELTFKNAINFIFNKLNDTYNEKRIQSVIFISAANNTDKNPVSVLKDIININNKIEYDFTFHTLSFNEDSKGGDLLDLSNYRDGSYYSINNFLQAKNSVLNIIGGLKTTNYKLVKINVTSSDTKFRIRYIFGYSHISNAPSISRESQFNIKIQQFITGKDYTYIFLMKLPDNMKNGEKILKISVEYKDFKNKELKNYKFLYYYNSVKYFDPKKDEFCRVKAFEAIYSYSINKININQYNKRISRISDDCQTNLNKNISDLMYDVYNSMEKKNWINGSVSEGYLKRGGIHLWYSNSYQLELINNYTDIKY